MSDTSGHQRTSRLARRDFLLLFYGLGGTVVKSQAVIEP